MRKYYGCRLVFFLFFQIGVAQNMYKNQWDKVETYELKDKSQSAYTLVKKIYKKAEQNQNESQFLKAFLYKTKYELILKEGSQETVYQHFLKAVKESSTPKKQLLASLLAESLEGYYKENRNKISQRTPKSAPATKDYKA